MLVCWVALLLLLSLLLLNDDVVLFDNVQMKGLDLLLKLCDDRLVMLSALILVLCNDGLVIFYHFGLLLDLIAEVLSLELL